MARNYYFVSSPLHLLFAGNLTLTRPTERHSLVLVPRPGQPFSRFSDVINGPHTLFDRVLSFEDDMQDGKRAERQRRMAAIRDELEQWPAVRIHTGTDRRVEFQYAMHVARKQDSQVQGVYVDDGMATYLGHKSAGNIAHRFLDPLGKKLSYGLWWDNPVTIGSSQWVDEIRVAYPELVHESLRHKPAVPIDRENFRDVRFAAMCQEILNARGVDFSALGQLDCVIVLTHESFYDEPLEHLNRLIESVLAARPQASIAIKPHPRSEMVQAMRAHCPQVEFLDSQTGMELLLAMLAPDCVIIGDVSSALFTTRWFSETTKVIAVKLPQSVIGEQAAPLYRLFESIDIQALQLAELSGAL